MFSASHCCFILGIHPPAGIETYKSSFFMELIIFISRWWELIGFTYFYL